MAPRLLPPWIRTKTTRNIAKRARLAAILRRKGTRMSKAEARKLCAEAVTGRPGIEPAPPCPGIRPGGIADRALQMMRCR